MTENDRPEEVQRIIDEETTPRGRTQEFEPGDIVYDREMFPFSSEPYDRMAFVIEQRDDWHTGEPAVSKDAVIQAYDMACTVASVNDDRYPGDDHVYTVAFVETLERDAVGFYQWTPTKPVESYQDYLDSLNTDWSLDIQTYDYPASRLYKAGHLELPGGEFTNDDRSGGEMTHGILTGGIGYEEAYFDESPELDAPPVDPETLFRAEQETRE